METSHATQLILRTPAIMSVMMVAYAVTAGARYVAADGVVALVKGHCASVQVDDFRDGTTHVVSGCHADSCALRCGQMCLVVQPSFRSKSASNDEWAHEITQG